MRQHDKYVKRWLLTGCFLVFAMVIIGGITRLTQSGLSMVEWKLIVGAIPPLTDVDWQEAFEKYRQSPEFNQINFEFTVKDFKTIFWWEYIHRLMGRVIGLVFVIPFVFFLVKKWMSPSMIKKCLVIFLLGGFQGFLGWYMVKSGLVDVPHVTHYRLAIHLITATLLYGYILWVALELGKKGLPEDSPLQNDIERPDNNVMKQHRRLSVVFLCVVLLQIVYGAFVAGLKAGNVYNTFPKMGDEWIAAGVTALEPLWRNFTEGLAGVQFAHRYIAYIIAFLSIAIWIKARKLKLDNKQMRVANILMIIVLIQFLLGVFTLLFVVPLVLAVLHQAGALLLFGTGIYYVYCLRRD